MYIYFHQVNYYGYQESTVLAPNPLTSVRVKGGILWK